MAGQQSIMGWSPNPVYNQPPLPSTQPPPQQPAPPSAHHPHGHGSHAHGPIRQAAAPTPLGAQAFALMSPQGNSTIMSPLTWQSQYDNLSYAMRSPGPGVPFMSPGPGQMMPTLLMPGKFEHYVPSVRYNPTDVNYAFTHQEEEEEGEEDNDGFVIVEEKARVPRPRKRQIGRESKLPFGLIKGMKNMFHRKHDPPPVMSTLPAGFVAWPKSPYEIDDAASQHLSEDHTTHAPTNAPTTLPYPSGRTYATWTAGMSPRSGYNSIFNTFRSPDPEPASALLPPPPKPPDWSHASDPTRPSWAYVLHPLLTHKAVGASMMHFDLRLPFSSITVFPPAAHPRLPPPGPVPLTQAQLDSHATWPPCPELTIASVADEPLFPVSPGLPGVFSGSGSFPWPIPVYPRESSEGGSVKVKDVLAALADSAMLHVRPSEYNALSASRREQVKLSYWARCTAASSQPSDGEDGEAERRVQPAPDDGCRRIDVLGTRVMFRGLEPAPGMDGTWVMFLGPP